jgi:hypothetical protein
MRRQQVLAREGLQARAVLDESILHRRIGSAAVMREQLARLAAESGQANVDIRVLPLDAQHTVFVGSFVIFGFGEDDGDSLHDVVSAEQMRSGITIEEERDTYLHRLAFEALSAAALDPVVSHDLIVSAAKVWAAEDGDDGESYARA